MLVGVQHGSTLFGMMIANHQYDCLWMSLSRLYLMFSGFIHPGLQYIYSRGHVISRFSSAYHTPKTLKNAQIRICWNEGR